jgi:uncharacterized protein
VQRKWKDGDRIDVEVPLKARLEALDPQHAETVALVVGPIVLFALTESAPTVTRAQLLAAKKTGTQSWRIETASGAMKILPFTAIEDQEYTTYLRVG